MTCLRYAQMTCLRYAQMTCLRYAQMTCLFPPPSGRPAGGQVLLLALARHGPDMDQLVPDLKRLDRTHGFDKLLKRLDSDFA